jgi:hypothetical protein
MCPKNNKTLKDNNNSIYLNLYKMFSLKNYNAQNVLIIKTKK